MTQEQKDLLIKDLSARLPYFTKVQIKNEIVVLNSICDDDGYHFNFINDNKEGVNIEQIKPYLFPLSSMTEEQREELFTVVLGEQVSISDCSFNDMTGYGEILTNYIIDAIDWLLKNHFDIRGLIPMGLANDATGLNIY